MCHTRYKNHWFWIGNGLDEIGLIYKILEVFGKGSSLLTQTYIYMIYIVLSFLVNQLRTETKRRRTRLFMKSRASLQLRRVAKLIQESAQDRDQ